MPRVIFKKNEQRKFLIQVLEKLNCPSLRALNQFGLEIPYSTLKNYYSEARTLPEEIFKNLCKLSGINKESLNYELVSENWGQIIGGQKRRKMQGSKNI